ncbi:Paired amphipathic helix protein Sin3-like 4 [Glycine soja]|uniref:Paired amphipathic helix protein Sin3-like 4 n=1 Tax=Glycine soja TaxID=3848 RepID=A0A0B2RD26_GLYSO|nr:Paired amphipathic helix protein Sin3-like 4 [Glycine soja]
MHKDGNRTPLQLTRRFAFCAKVKDKVQNPKNYFSKHVGIYSKEKITQQELQLWATDFLRIYPDLMKGFNECVTQCKKMNEEVYVGSVKKTTSGTKTHGFIRILEG